MGKPPYADVIWTYCYPQFRLQALALLRPHTRNMYMKFINQDIGTLFHYAVPFTGTSPNWKYFQNGPRRSSACALAIVGIYNVSTTNTLSTLIQRTILHYLSSFQRRISLGGQLIWWIWTSIARLLPSIDRVDQSMPWWPGVRGHRLAVRCFQVRKRIRRVDFVLHSITVE